MDDKIFLINSLRKGGAERQAAFFLKSFPEFKVITLEPGCEYEVSRNQILFSPSLKKNKISQLFSTILKLIKIKPKIIISFLEFSNYINILSSFITKHKAIISVRTSLAFHKGLKGKINLFLIKLLYPHADLITSNSSDSILLLKRYLKLNDNHFALTPNAIDDHIYRENHYSPPVLREVLKIIIVGRLESIKNFQAAIRIIAKLKESVPCQLSIIGDGSERASLIKLCENLALSFAFTESNDCDCIFYGKIDAPEFYLRKNHLFLLTSLAEGLPNTLLEAMANKLPCIASDCPTGPKELMSNQIENLLPIPCSDEIIQTWVDSILNMSENNLFSKASSLAYSQSLKYNTKEIKKIWATLCTKS